MAAKKPTRRALACRVDLSFSARAGGVGRALNATTLPYATSGDSSFEVLANDEFARFSALSPATEPLWTMVRSGANRGTSVWDHTQRKVFILDEAEVPRVAVARPTTVSVRITRSKRGATARLLIADDLLGAVRHELRFRNDPALGPHGPALLKLLFGGPGCHEDSGFPLERLSTLGCLESASVYLGDESVAIATFTIKEPRSTASRAQDFEPPIGYEVVRAPAPAADEDKPVPAPPAVGRGPEVVPPRPLPVLPVPVAAVHQQALSADESFTPDCLGTTRHGSMALVIHQDILDHTTRALNAAASLLGVATISGEVRINWLSDLRAIRAGSATAPGTGLFCALEDTRVKATAMSPARGGRGYLDQLAVQALFAQAASEVATGALSNSMQSWGITSTNLIAKVFAANGNLRDPSITTSERIDIANAFTTATFGTLRIPGLPYEVDASIPGFFEVKLWSLTGTMNFASLGGAPLIPVATIGSSGNILITIAVPTTTLTATATWRLLPLADALLNVATLVSCILFPFSCAFAVPANLLLKQFLQTQLSVVTASAAGLSIGFDIRYAFDPSRGVVAPTVAVSSVTGSVSLLSTNSRAPIVIQAVLNMILITVEQQLQLWRTALVAALRGFIETQLLNLGLECPLGATPLGLSAASGSAASVANSRLTLQAELRHDPLTASHPYATQVPTSSQLASELETCHGAMRSDLLTPVPVPPFAPTPPGVGVYGGVTFSQNALNQYVDVHWRRRAFQWETSNPSDIQRLLGVAPPNLFTRAVHRIHAWLAAPPRVELAEGGFANREHPLIVFFDDLRICFQGIGPADGDVPGNTSMLELSADAKAKAAVTFSGFTPGLVFDLTSIEAGDTRVWSVADPNNPSLQVSNAWLTFVLGVTARLLRPWDAAPAIAAPVAPPAWRQPIPATRPQRFFSVGGAGILGAQDGYFEVLGRRRALYMIPAVRSLFLELVDGFGAPTLNIALGNTPVAGMPFTPVTMTSMTCAQGSSLRATIGAGLVIPP